MALEQLPLAGLVDLNGDGSYLSLGVVRISWANLVVILLMLITFVAALLLPFPGGRRPAEAPVPPAPDAGPAPDGAR